MPRPESDYERIVNHVRTRITAGEWKPGERLPTYERMSTEYEVSITTLQSALRVLRETGWIVGRQGKGIFVAERPPTGG